MTKPRPLDSIVDSVEGDGFSRTQRELEEAKKELASAYRNFCRARSRVDALNRDAARIWNNKMWSKQ